MADWDAIRREYINGTDSYRTLSEKYGLSHSALMKRGASEKWAQKREETRRRVAEKVQRKAEEKMADSLSEVAAIQSRVRLKLMQMIEKSVPTIDDEDVDKLRKLVSAYKDMCEINSDDAGEDKQGGGVIEIPAIEDSHTLKGD